MAVPGVSGVQVNLLAGSMAVEYDENACDAQTIIKAVESGGYATGCGGRWQADLGSGARKARRRTEALMK